MNLVLPNINRFIEFIRCLKKPRYGYLDRDMCYIPSGDNSLEMVLSPDLYRICIASLPVKTAKEAVVYAASYFEESQEESLYSAYKIKDGEYLFCAFFPQIVRERLEELHVSLVLVNRFIFAQEFFDQIHFPIALGNGSVLALNNGVVICVRSEYVDEIPKFFIQELLKNLSLCFVGFKADLEVRGAVTKKTAMFSIALFIIVFFNLLFQGLYFHHEANKIEDEQEHLRVQKKLPSTQIEFDTLVSSWEKKEKNQIKMRRVVATFSTLSLENHNTPQVKSEIVPVSQTNSFVLIPGTTPSDRNVLLLSHDSNFSSKIVASEYISSLNYENGVMNFEISTPSQERAQKIRDEVAKILGTNTIAVKRNLVEGSVN